MNISKEKLTKAIDTFARYLEKKGFFDPIEASKSEVMEDILQADEDSLDDRLDYICTPEGCEELLELRKFRRLKQTLRIIK